MEAAGFSKNMIHRIDAMPSKNGRYGALVSQLKSLKFAVDNKYEHSLIIQDDMEWTISPLLVRDILEQNLKDNTWSVLLLSCYYGIGKQRNNFNNHATNCQTATAYIIRKRYYDTLYTHWNTYLERKLILPDIYKRSIVNGYEVALDQSWKILQNQHMAQWAATRPLLAYQRPDMSDIEHKNVNYGKPSVPEHMKRNNANSKTTIVIMGYSSKRYSNYEIIFRSYGSMTTVLDKIILIWCNQISPPPAVPTESSVPVVILRAATNSLNNRYVVTDMVRTSTVVSVDDDLKLSEALIRLLVKTHYQQPNRLIGVDGRSYDLNGQYIYHTNPGTTMVLTKTWIISKRFFAPYMKDNILLDFINSKDVHNCEDIAMNFVVQTLTGNDALIVKMDKQHYRETLPEPDGLSISTSADKWNAKRSKCVKWMLNHFRMGL